jgi:hypothetical protein
MKRRHIFLGAIICCALVIAAGLRIGIGQGYSGPIVLPREVQPDAVRSERTLEVRLTNQKTGRPQHHQWSLSVPKGGAVKIECHEWVVIDFYGFSMPGFPKNSFRRIIQLDSSEEGVAEPYHFVIRWRPKKPNQSSQRNAMPRPISVFESRSSRG